MATATEVPRPRDAGRTSCSSSPGLSSPPSVHSPSNAISPSISVAHPTHVLPSTNGNVNVKVGGEKATELRLAKNTAVVKKPRKKRESNSKHESKSSTTTTATDVKEPHVKVRKPRAAPGSSSSVGRKRKVVVVESSDIHSAPAQHQPRQSKITDTVRSSLPPRDFGVLASTPPHQNGNNEAIANSATSSTGQAMPSTTPRSSSGQNYDPIRSATIESRTRSPHNSYNAPVRSPTPPKAPPKYASASASPSIASLIEPSNPSYNFPKPPKRNNDMQAPLSPTNKKPRLSPPPNIHAEQTTSSIRDSSVANAQAVNNNAMSTLDVDMDQGCPTSGRTTTLMKKSNSTSTGASSTAHSPKPFRQREPTIPLPSGNGLLSSAMFGGAYDNAGPERSAPTVIFDVSLDGADNKYVNFARMAEERYGFNALHPRLAAQRERLARVAAAGAAIEYAHKIARNSGSGVSADEMSVDLSENDGGGDDSNVEMGGTSLHDVDMGGLGRSGGEGSEATLLKKAPKKRLMKEDYYDKDDPFVDDTELAWEEQAAASKDGFFVYSGPLVPEGEKANVERAEGTTKRGRGKGRGGSRRGGGTRRGGSAAAKPTPPTRKPRVTKAEKVQMEQEKAQRENMAILAAKPTGYPG